MTIEVKGVKTNNFLFSNTLKNINFDKPKVVSGSQKSKADDLVFIKIVMSNHPSTTTPPNPPTPPGKVSKKQDRAILPK